MTRSKYRRNRRNQSLGSRSKPIAGLYYLVPEAATYSDGIVTFYMTSQTVDTTGTDPTPFDLPWDSGTEITLKNITVRDALSQNVTREATLIVLDATHVTIHAPVPAIDTTVKLQMMPLDPVLSVRDGWQSAGVIYSHNLY